MGDKFFALSAHNTFEQWSVVSGQSQVPETQYEHKYEESFYVCRSGGGRCRRFTIGLG
jgi:hypothetical protein